MGPTLGGAIKAYGVPVPIDRIYAANSITREELDAMGAKGRGGICGGVPQGDSQAGEGETGRRIRQGPRYALGSNRIGF